MLAPRAPSPPRPCRHAPRHAAARSGGEPPQAV